MTLDEFLAEVEGFALSQEATEIAGKLIRLARAAKAHQNFDSMSAKEMDDPKILRILADQMADYRPALEAIE